MLSAQDFDKLAEILLVSMPESFSYASPWFEHSGSMATMPMWGVDARKKRGLELEVKFRQGNTAKIVYPEVLRWAHGGYGGDIVAYRYVRR